MAGFIISTLANHTIHTRLGQRGIVLIGSTCHVVAYSAASLRPPFPALMVMYILVGLGSGTKQAAWNFYVGGMQNPNELLGLLHGFYGTGATITPSVASVLFTKYGWQWFQIYYPLVGMVAVDVLLSLSAFSTQSGRTYRESNCVEPQERSEPGSPLPDHRRNESPGRLAKFRRSQTFLCLRTKVVLLSSAYLLSYVGSEVALGGWMINLPDQGSARHSFYLWSCVERVLGRHHSGQICPWVRNDEASQKRKARRFMLPSSRDGYAVVVLAYPQFYCVGSQRCAVGHGSHPSHTFHIDGVDDLAGFFLGPLFPRIVLCFTRLLPKSIQVSAIGIRSAVSASGASIVPLAV